ncbi:hypothetical protein D3C86_1455100 [compost metagenome]
MAAPGGAVQHIPEQGDQQNHGDDAIGEDRVAETDIGAEELQDRRLLGNVLGPDRLIRGIEEVGRKHDLPHAKRDDEGRQAHARNQHAVDEAAKCADGETTENGKLRRKTVTEGKLPHDDGGQNHDRADRKVDARRQDDKRLRGANDADDRNLLQDEGQREGGEKLAA